MINARTLANCVPRTKDAGPFCCTADALGNRVFKGELATHRT